MKILVVTNLFHPDRGGGASVFSDLCYGLAERKHDVTVYTAYPYYPEWENKSGKSLWRTRQETIEGVRVYRHGFFIPKNPSKLIPRLAFEFSFLVSLLRSLFRFKKFDIVMVYCPLAGAVAYASVRKIFYREPLWLNVQDIPADAAAASGISNSGLMNKIASGIQSFIFNSAKTWSTIAPEMVERLETIRKKDQPIHYCPNFLNKSMSEHVANHPSKVGRPASTPIQLLYAGNIGKKQGLLEFCKMLAKTEVDFVLNIHGNGGEAANIQQWVEQSNDTRFKFGGFLDEAGFIQALVDTDLFIISEKPGVGASFIPSKLIPCIATGTPVACVCDSAGPLGKEVRKHGLGITLNWNEAEQFTEKLKGIMEGSINLTEMQENAAKRSIFYDRSKVISHFEEEMKKIVASRK